MEDPLTGAGSFHSRRCKEGCLQTGRSTRIPPLARLSTTTRWPSKAHGTSQRRPLCCLLDVCESNQLFHDFVPMIHKTVFIFAAYWSVISRSLQWNMVKANVNGRSVNWGWFVSLQEMQGGLPPDWEEHKDPSTGKTFYYNKVTKERSRNMPKEAIVLQSYCFFETSFSRFWFHCRNIFGFDSG